MAVGTDGRAYVYNCTFNPELAMLDPVTGKWTSTTYPGWSTVADITYGGVGHYNQYVFASDMYTFGAAERGIIRFDTAAGTAQRFADTTDFISLTVGPDGDVYGLLGAGGVGVYDPSTLALVRQISLTASGSGDPRGIAVDAAGDIFLTDNDGYLYHVSPSGQFIDRLNTTPPGGIVNDLFNIDAEPNGQLVVGNRFGGVIHTDEAFASSSVFQAGSGWNFVAFVPAGPSLVVSGFPSSTTAGSSGSITVTVDGASGNTDTGYTGTVHFTSSDGQAVLPADYTFTAADAGTHTFTNAVTLKTADTQSVTATDLSDPAVTGSEGGITVSPAAASQLLVTTQPPTSVFAGAGFGLTVSSEDPYGNLATGFAGSVAVALANNPGGATLGGKTSVNASGGVAAFAGLTLDRPGGGYTLQATSTGLSPATTNTITVDGPVLSSTSVPEFRPVGTPVGTLSTSEPGSGHTFSYALVSGIGSADNGSFSISGNQLLTADAFDAGARSSYSVRVRSTDEANQTVEVPFTITVTDDPALTLKNGTLTITGTSGNDTFTFTPGTPQDAMTLNGTALAVDAAAAKSVVFNGGGGGGSDSATLNGAAAGGNTLTATLDGGGTLSGPGYSVTVNAVDQVVATGHPGDRAYLFDDTYSGVFVGTPTYAYQRGYFSEDSHLLRRANGFSVVLANGGGLAYLYDSPGNDVFVGTPNYSYLYGPGFFNQVDNFGNRVATSSAGGNDSAYLFGGSAASPAVFVATPTYAYLYGAGPQNQADGFKVVVGNGAGTGSNAYLFGSPAGGNAFVGTSSYSYLYGAGFFNQAQGFQNVTGTSGGAGDLAYLFDTAGGEFVATSAYAYVTGAGQTEQANGFHSVYGYSGGGDTAYLYGTMTAADTYVNGGSYAYLYGDAFFILEAGFASVWANPNARR